MFGPLVRAFKFLKLGSVELVWKDMFVGVGIWEKGYPKISGSTVERYVDIVEVKGLPNWGLPLPRTCMSIDSSFDEYNIMGVLYKIICICMYLFYIRPLLALC